MPRRTPPVHGSRRKFKQLSSHSPLRTCLHTPRPSPHSTRWPVLGAQGHLNNVGGIYQIVAVGPSPAEGHLAQRWVPAGPRPSLCPVPRVGQRLCPIGRRAPLPLAALLELAHHHLIVDCPDSATSSTVLAAIPDRLLPHHQPRRPGPRSSRNTSTPNFVGESTRTAHGGSPPLLPRMTSSSSRAHIRGGGCIIFTQDSASR